jgi:ribosomal protein S18 acetylase RimI-like enzyme
MEPRSLKFEVRRLTNGDEPVMQRLTADADRFEAPGTRPRDLPVPRTEVAQRFLNGERNHLLVAFDRDEPVGLLLAYELLRRHGDDPKLHLYELGVREDYRRRGVGRQLVESLAELARAHGATRAFVITDESNRAAMAFYASVGGVRLRGDDALFFFSF